MAMIAGARVVARGAGLLKNTSNRLTILRSAVASQLNQRFIHAIRRTSTPIPTQVFYQQSRENRSYINRKDSDIWRKIADEHLTCKKIEDRLLGVIRRFGEYPVEKITMDTHFIHDLGLDSLDYVELIMLIEHEFWIDIPDLDPETLATPAVLLRYIAEKEGVTE